MRVARNIQGFQPQPGLSITTKQTFHPSDGGVSQRVSSISFGSTSSPSSPTVHTQASAQEVLDKIKYRPGFFFVSHGDQLDGQQNTGSLNYTPAQIRSIEKIIDTVTALVGKSADKAPFVQFLREKLTEAAMPKVSVQVQFMAPDSTVPGSEPSLRTGARKWPIRPDATPGQIAQTVFMALLAVEEHELRESFLLNGKRIFNPHFDIDELVTFLKNQVQKPLQPETLYGDKASLEVLFNQIRVQNYRLQVVSVTPLDQTKQVIVFQLKTDPDAITKGTSEYEGKFITYVTGKDKTRILRNLMDALIEEQRKEVRDQFQFDGFPMFGNDVPISLIEAYVQGKPI